MRRPLQLPRPEQRPLWGGGRCRESARGDAPGGVSRDGWLMSPGGEGQRRVRDDTVLKLCAWDNASPDTQREVREVRGGKKSGI